MKNNIVVTVLIAIVIGVAGFFGGIKYQQSQSPAFSRQFGNGQQGLQQGGTRSGMNRTGSRQVAGEILSQDDKSITVKLADGSSKIVLLSGTTTINTATKAAVADLKVGEKVAVFGPQNTDGSVTAQMIQLNPVGRPTP